MPQAQVIYRRTAHGSAELISRRPSLEPALNSLLLLVDGQRSGDELLRIVLRLGAPGDSLEKLQIGNYIQRVHRATEGVKAPILESAADTAQDEALFELDDEPDSPKRKTLTDAERRASLYKYLIEAVKKHLGLKGFIYHMKVEKAVTLAELLDLIDPLGNAIAKAQGLDAANRFMAQGRQLTRA